MTSIRTKFSVGLFVIIGFAVMAIAVIWLGMSRYFEKGQFYVAYFDESVQGLDKDSPVKYRGVPIGRVESLGVAPDATLIQVIMKIESGLKNREYQVAQLKSVGITGIMFIELDRKSKNAPNLSPRISFPPKYPVVATKPSGIKKFMGEMDDVLKQIKELDTKGISDNFKTTLDTISQTVEDAQVKELVSDIRISLHKINKILNNPKLEIIMDSFVKAGSSFNALTTNANKTVSNINTTITRLDRNIEDIKKGFGEAVSDFKHAMENVDIFMKNGTGLINDTDNRLSNLQRHFIISLKNLERAGENLNRFLEIVADQPSQLIFGEPPPAREVEKENTHD